MRARCVSRWVVLVAVFMAVAALGDPGALAQEAQKTASQFYTEYRAAFEKAKTIDEILPYMSASRRKQVEATPAGERKKMFEFIKMMGTLSNVKIVKEARTDAGATLTVEALDSDKAKTTGTITPVKESNAWKLEKESFFSGSK